MEIICQMELNKRKYLSQLIILLLYRNKFQIAISLKHLLGMIKVCELIEGKFMSAMELLDVESCVSFLFTHT
mgnify:CR=1 FL=1